jgi:hypothetical protein
MSSDGLLGTAAAGDDDKSSPTHTSCICVTPAPPELGAREVAKARPVIPS